jgi:ribosomal protein L32
VRLKACAKCGKRYPANGFCKDHPPNVGPRSPWRAVDPNAHRRWAYAVKKRAGNRCQECGSTDGLVAHHITSPRDGGAPLDMRNGVALCALHHKFVDRFAR